VRKGTPPPGLGPLASAALTAVSTLVVAGFAAVVGVVIAREFGRTDETDGFFAAYGVFLVIVLAAQAIRLAVLPSLARAREERRLAGEIVGFAVAIATIAVPLVVVAQLAAGPIAELLTGGDSDVAQEAATTALRWLVPAGVAHLFAGLAASGLAALDDYATAAFGYAVGSAAGLALILARIEPDGIVAVAWGMTLNGAVALLVPLVGLVWRARATRMPRGAVRPTGLPLGARLAAFSAGAALPIALQALYVVCLPFAGRLGTGAVTSFVYAYLGASALVAVTASSLGLVSSVPLTRAGLGPVEAARHVVSASWLGLAFVGAAAGIFASAGADLVETVLGAEYTGDIGAEVGELVVAFSPWMIVSVGVSVAFPLTFVVDRTRGLPWIGLGALALQVPLAWAGWRILELTGLALALGLSTFAVLVGLLAELRALRPALRGLAAAALTLAAITVAAFLPPALLLGAVATAVVGLGLYAVLLRAARPRGLRAAWHYLRALGSF
jgi:O-antigen/teichoic acid export membrane protein